MPFPMENNFNNAYRIARYFIKTGINELIEIHGRFMIEIHFVSYIAKGFAIFAK